MSAMDAFIELCREAEEEGRQTLLEPELYAFLREAGLSVPPFYSVDPSRPLDDQVKVLGTGKVVVKVVSPAITHKTEMGGVRVSDDEKGAIMEAIRGVLEVVRTRGGEKLASTIGEVLVAGFVNGDKGIGGEFFVGLRQSRDMGPTMAAGFGGLDAEEMAAKFQPGQSMVILSPLVTSVEDGLAKCYGAYSFRRLTGRTRQGKRLVEDAELARIFEFFYALARESVEGEAGYVVEEFEVNPFLASDGKLVAVDAFLRFSRNRVKEPHADIEKVRLLLKPSTIAIVGASRKGMNPGRVILRNLLREGFPKEFIRCLRPDPGDIDGVECVPAVKDLPWSADLLVVSVEAGQVPTIIEDAVTYKKATSILVVSSGMGETESGKETDLKVQRLLFGPRETGGWSPVVVGPNCLGIRSRPGRYDTLFIPETKLPLPEGGLSRVALVCQSGAFMVSRMSAMPYLDPIYLISIGNQLDLTLPDFVEALKDDPLVDGMVLYIEGFKPMDGLRLARLVREARQTGKDVIVYRAGRTAEGITATSSHTASVSGDYASCAEILKDAGAMVVESLDEFKAMLTMVTALRHRRVGGSRFGIMSNAGFEIVGMCDNILPDLGGKLATLSPRTVDSIRALMAEKGIDRLITIHNPLDFTPMSNDTIMARSLEAYLSDEGVDAVVMGVVPMTPALKTLPPGADPSGVDNIDDAGALPALLPPIIEQAGKPVVLVVDAGSLYDPLAKAFNMKGIPCVRSADVAIRGLQRYIAYRGHSSANGKPQ